MIKLFMVAGNFRARNIRWKDYPNQNVHIFFKLLLMKWEDI